MLTAVDACNVSRYKRNQLRGVLQAFPEYAARPTSPRVAWEFSRMDLLVLSVVHFLDQVLHIRRPAIGLITDQLRKELSSPRSISPKARLSITFSPPSVRYLSEPEVIDNGVLVPLGAIFWRVDVYIAGGKIDEEELKPNSNLASDTRSTRSKRAKE